LNRARLQATLPSSLVDLKLSTDRMDKDREKRTMAKANHINNDNPIIFLKNNFEVCTNTITKHKQNNITITINITEEHLLMA
jgi:hypothetical protein